MFSTKKHFTFMCVRSIGVDRGWEEGIVVAKRNVETQEAAPATEFLVSWKRENVAASRASSRSGYSKVIMLKRNE